MAITTRTKERISKGLRKYQTVLKKAIEDDINESDTVTIIADILCDVFGFDKYDNITSEFAIRKTYCDLAIKISGKVPLLIECKAIGVDLKDDHVRQATNYAAEQGTEWVILTNGRMWRVYHILFTQPIDKQLVYEFDFLDLSSRRIDTFDLLYPLCIEAFPKGRSTGLDDLFEQKQILNRYVVGQITLSDEVLTCIRRRMKRLFPNVKVETDDLRKVISSEIMKRDIIEGDSSADATKIIKKAERKLTKNKAE